MEEAIANLCNVYASERFRLLHANKSEAERERIQQEVFTCWPFSPELLNLLEDHILLSSAAQETRDLIRILAQVFRSRGEVVPLITPADFFVDGNTDEVQTLVDSIAIHAGQDKLRQIAQRNLEAVNDSGVYVPNARELVSAIWMRSMTPGRNPGGSPSVLHLDITRKNSIDDNAFQAELALLIENSVNIHGDEVHGGMLWFGVNENPRSKVRACAKNAKLWNIGAVPTAGQTVYPSKDVQHIRNTLKHILVPETTSPTSRVIVLGPNWRSDPWSEVEDSDIPSKWDRPVLIVIPELINNGQSGISATLGEWLKTHVLKRRNTVRFLLLSADTQSLFADDELVFAARCSFLCSKEGWGNDSIFRALHQDFDRPLRAALKSKFNRFAIIRKWDYQQPQNCQFEIEKISEQSGDVPAAVEDRILKDIFDQTEFKLFILERAKDSDFMAAVLDELTEPPAPNARDAIPFLGETKTYEFIQAIAANGDIVLNVSGTWFGRRSEDATNEDALRNIKPKTFRSGQELRQIQLGLPAIVGGGTVTSQPQVSAGTPSGKPEVVPPQGGAFPIVAEGAGALTAPPYPESAENWEDAPVAPVAAMPEPVKSKKSEEPTSGINLSGCFENWGISSSQLLESASIEFSGLTAQQIKQILQRIPSNYKATLEIAYKKEGE